MPVKVFVELCPFEVPTKVFIKQEPVTRQEGFKEAPSYKLTELDDSTLDRYYSI